MAAVVCLAERVWVYPQLDVAGVSHVLDLQRNTQRKQTSGRPCQMRLSSQTQPLRLSSTARSLFTMKDPCGFARPHTPLQQADAQSVARKCLHAV
jgi:hypothetical protein